MNKQQVRDRILDDACTFSLQEVIRVMEGKGARIVR